MKLGCLDSLPDGDNWVVYAEAIQKHPFGWVVFYGSRLFMETGSIQYAVAGNAPFIVNRLTGEVVVTGTAQPVDDYVAEYREHLKRLDT